MSVDHVGTRALTVNQPGFEFSWWRHQMEKFSALLAICAGNSPVAGEFPAQRPVTRSFDVFFICAWINGWVNNREAGDLRSIRPHYDITVMLSVTGYNIRDKKCNPLTGCCKVKFHKKPSINTLRQYGRQFADDILIAFSWLKCMCLIKISLKFILYGPIDNKSALVQIMLWHRTVVEALYEPVMV